MRRITIELLALPLLAGSMLCLLAVSTAKASADKVVLAECFTATW